MTYNMKWNVISCHKKKTKNAKNRNSYIEFKFAYGKFPKNEAYSKAINSIMQSKLFNKILSEIYIILTKTKDIKKNLIELK